MTINAVLSIDDIRAIAISAVGGLLLNLIPLWEDRHKPKADRALKDSVFWAFLFIWPLISGFLAYLYILEGSTLKPLLAFSVGLGAPATIRSAMSAAVPLPRPPKSSEP